jgi:sugar/nucleoside kinase (ribokinase family)
MKGRTGADDELPAPEVIRAAGVLFIDDYNITGNIRAATIAHEAGVPIVADFEHGDAPQFERLLGLVDHPILSKEFAMKFTAASDPAEAALKLWTPQRSAVVVTCGAEGCWYVADSHSGPIHQPAFAVEAVDTTGCGDVFHGAYASALIRGLPLPRRIAFASAAAALKATQTGGIQAIPTRSQVEALLDGITRAE